MAVKQTVQPLDRAGKTEHTSFEVPTVSLLIAENTIDKFIDFSLAQKHRLAKYTQADSDIISDADLALRKPDVLRVLLAPAT